MSTNKTKFFANTFHGTKRYASTKRCYMNGENWRHVGLSLEEEVQREMYGQNYKGNKRTLRSVAWPCKKIYRVTY